MPANRDFQGFRWILVKSLKVYSQATPINIYYNMTAKKIPPAAAKGIASKDI
jgi:hypothetical protein